MYIFKIMWFRILQGNKNRILTVLFYFCNNEQIKARGADLIVITDKPSLAEGLNPNPIAIANNGPLTALGAVLSYVETMKIGV